MKSKKDIEVRLNKGPLPRYHQVANLIRTEIMVGDWPPGSKLPTEKNLAEKYGVSRITIRNAKDLLSEEGFVRSAQGSGCYVNEQESWSSIVPTVDNISDVFHFGSRMSFKIHEFGMAANTPEVKRKLKNHDDHFVFQIKGVRSNKGRPVSCVTYFWPYVFGTRISMDSLDENPFIPQLEKLAGIQVVEGIQTISLDKADKQDAGHLDIQEGDPVLLVESIYFDEEDNVVEYVRSRYRDRVPYSFKVKRL